MDGLACHNCRQISGEFTILNCDHVVCAECLWSEVRTSLQGVNSIACLCGTVTSFAGNSKISERKSIRKQTMSQMQTDMPTYSSRDSATNNDRTISQQPKGQLENELYFLDLQFKKSLEEAENNFERVVQLIKEKYTNLVAIIRNFWQQETAGYWSITIPDFSSMLAKKYKEAVGAGLADVNQALLKHLTIIRLEPKTHKRTHSTSSSLNRSFSSQINKENTLPTSNYFSKNNLLNAIHELKKRNQNIRKIGLRQKTFFNRNR